MTEERSVVIVSDYSKIRNAMKATLTEAVDCLCAVECLDRDEFNKRLPELKKKPTSVVFAFPRQERYLIYDKSDPYNTLQREIDAVGIDQTMIFIQYKEDVNDETLIHSNLAKLLQYGIQKDLFPYIEQGRVLSLKEEFNTRQWRQIETLFKLPIKGDIKQRKRSRRQIEKELATTRQEEKEKLAQQEAKQAKHNITQLKQKNDDAQGEEEQAKATTDEIPPKDEKTQRAKQAKLENEPLKTASDEQEWREVVKHFEKSSGLLAALLRVIRGQKGSNRASLRDSESRIVQKSLQELSEENLELLLKATETIRWEFEYALDSKKHSK